MEVSTIVVLVIIGVIVIYVNLRYCDLQQAGSFEQPL
jgi:ABC-type uncharacterized transport system permease subunit